MTRPAIALVAIGVAALACNPSTKPVIGTDGTSTSGAATGSSGAVPLPSTPPSPVTPSTSDPPRKPGEGIKVSNAAADGDALSTIRTERLKAKSEGRVLVVYVSATWCEPCKRMKDEIHAGHLDAQLGKTTLLAFDADKDGDRLASAGYKFGFIPFVALPGADGHPAASLEAKGKGSNAWRELVGTLEEWQKRGP